MVIVGYGVRPEILAVPHHLAERNRNRTGRTSGLPGGGGGTGERSPGAPLGHDEGLAAVPPHHSTLQLPDVVGDEGQKTPAAASGRAAGVVKLRMCPHRVLEGIHGALRLTRGFMILPVVLARRQPTCGPRFTGRPQRGHTRTAPPEVLTVASRELLGPD